jgi:hypothetical protein
LRGTTIAADRPVRQFIQGRKRNEDGGSAITPYALHKEELVGAFVCAAPTDYRDLCSKTIRYGKPGGPPLAR